MARERRYSKRWSTIRRSTQWIVNVFIPLNYGGLRDQICTAQGTKENCVEAGRILMKGS